MVQKNTLSPDVLEQRVSKFLQKEIANFNKYIFFIRHYKNRWNDRLIVYYSKINNIILTYLF